MEMDPRAQKSRAGGRDDTRSGLGSGTMPLPIPPLRAAALVVLLLALGACRSEPPPTARSGAPTGPPAAAFLRIPAVSRVTISPDGKHVAGISSNEGVQVVFETAHATRDVNYLTKIAPETVIQAFGWSGDG